MAVTVPYSFGPTQTMLTPIRPPSPSLRDPIHYAFPPIPQAPITPRSVVAGGEICARLEMIEREILAADSSYNPSWLYEPPLPPPSADVLSRIDSLGEQLRQKELELETTQSECQATVAMLQTMMREQEANTARRVEEAVTMRESRIREEIRAEVQILLRNAEEQNERLSAKLAEVERERNELRLEADTSRKVARQQTLRLELTVEELQKQLEAMAKDKKLLSDHHLRWKEANGYRSEEAASLKKLVEEERKLMQHMQAERDMYKSERDTARADLEALRARARLDSDGKRLQESIGRQLSPRPSTGSVQYPWPRGAAIGSVPVDITEGQDAPGIKDSWTLTSRTRAPTEISQSYGFQGAMAVAGIDTTGDGRADVFVSGIDRNRDGIPDVLQA